MPDVGKIYVLIKAKNEEVALKRLKNEVCLLLYISIGTLEVYPSL